MHTLPILLLILTTLPSLSHAQFPATTDSVYTFIKSNSVLRTTVDWTQIDKSFKEDIESARSLKDTMECFVSVLKELNDVHSQIWLNGEYYGHYPSFEDSVLVWLKPLNDKANSVTNQIHAEMIADDIGYIRVPSMQAYDPSQINSLAETLVDKVIKLSEECKKGYIIDLRLNGGGNIYPMLSGLSPFLGDQTIGYETDVVDSIVRSWELKNGNFVLGGYQTTDINVELVSDLTSMPIVVITGPVTKSSGSMTAIAFKGRPNTVFIGEPTADGYTTSNGYFQFAPNLMFNFATHYVADRNMHIYKTTVDPDIVISGGDDFKNLLEDKKVAYAIQWLKGK